MSNLQLIEAFSQIIEAQAYIISKQHDRLISLGVHCMEDEISAVRAAYSDALGSNEMER